MKAKQRYRNATTSELVRPKEMLKWLAAADADEDGCQEDDKVEEPMVSEERQAAWEELVENYDPDEGNEEEQAVDDLIDDCKDEGLGHVIAAREKEKGREPKTLKSPVKVAKAQREKHECTHAPFQPWCRYCVKAIGVNKAHIRKKGKGHVNNELGKVPRVSMDY